jgi:hypothetical protein
VLINDNLEFAAENLMSIVRAERVRRIRVDERVQPILATFGRENGVSKQRP